MTLRWLVVGVGTAGQARSRAIAASPRSVLKAVHRGRYAHEVAAEFDAAVREDGPDLFADIDVVAVAAPSAVHPAWVARALDAGCHVVVEYPLAARASDAAALLRRAQEAGRVLHVEHIELLSPTTTWLLGTPGPWRAAGVEGSAPGEAGQEALARDHLARVHRAVALAETWERVDVLDASDVRIDAVLHGARAPVSLRLSRGLRGLRAWVDGAERREVIGRTLRIDGAEVPWPGGPSLFARDTAVAEGRVLDGAEGYLSDAHLVGVQHLVDTLGKAGPRPFSHAGR